MDSSCDAPLMSFVDRYSDAVGPATKNVLDLNQVPVEPLCTAVPRTRRPLDPQTGWRQNGRRTAPALEPLIREQRLEPWDLPRTTLVVWVGRYLALVWVQFSGTGQTSPASSASPASLAINSCHPQQCPMTWISRGTRSVGSSSHGAPRYHGWLIAESCTKPHGSGGSLSSHVHLSRLDKRCPSPLPRWPAERGCVLWSTINMSQQRPSREFN